MATPGVHTLQADPEVLGDYEVLLPIGSGGMGNVYLARKRIIGDVYREFALKLIRPQLEANAAWSNVLMEEAKIAARIRHPNVVSVLEVADGPWGVYLVMDYVEGVSLAGLNRLAAKRDRELPLRIVARVLHDALAGLHAVHELRDPSGDPLSIVHRDVSPQNLLVGADGTTRLTDFGIAKARSRPDTTDTGAIKGKLRYMAPEQALAKPLDRRVDVWAAAVVAWEAIAGEHLFPGDTDAETLLRIVTKPEVPPLCERRADVPVEVDEALAMALHLEREGRCPTALELQRRLEAAWRAADGMADPHEVAAFVGEIAGPELAKRRERAHRTVVMPPLAGDETRTVNVVDAPERQTARRGRLAAASGAAALVLVALGAYQTGLLRRGEDTPLARPGFGAHPTSREATAATTAPASPGHPADGATTASAGLAPPRLLEVRADTPLREVDVDGRKVLLSEPSRTASVQMPATDGAPVRVQVVAVDGRRAQELVSADAGEVSFAIGPATAKPTKAPARPAADRKLLPYRPSTQDPP